MPPLYPRRKLHTFRKGQRPFFICLISQLGKGRCNAVLMCLFEEKYPFKPLHSTKETSSLNFIRPSNLNAFIFWLYLGKKHLPPSLNSWKLTTREFREKWVTYCHRNAEWLCVCVCVREREREREREYLKLCGYLGLYTIRYQNSITSPVHLTYCDMSTHCWITQQSVAS
jgi:hypothetical protein